MPVSQPLRICFAGWADHVHLERWAGYFARSGHEVGVFSFSDTGRYPESVVQSRIAFRDRGAFWRRLHLRWLLARFRPQIVHIHWAAFAHYFVALWDGPLVITAWGSDVYRLAEQPPAVRQQTRAAFERADAITCDSDDLAAAIAQLAPSCASRITVIQWGVDTDLFSPAVDATPLAKELNIENRPVIFSARNFMPIYNQDVILRAFALVRQTIPEAVLIMKNYNGRPDYLAAMRILVSELGLEDSVRIIDSIPYEQMPQIYALSSATVSIPSSDATPMALLEAMACGSVPVFSDLPSLREWIASGENGFLVDCKDAAGLATCITNTISNKELCKRIASTNRNLVGTRASQHFWMGKVDQLYRLLLS
ncbi:MAG: glycosyltransferase family 4 protein [Pseudomonadota bacterium]